MKNYILTIDNEPASVIISDDQLNDFKKLIPLAVKEHLCLDELPKLTEVAQHNDVNYDVFLTGDNDEPIEAYLVLTEIYKTTN
jgi:hypothetical protein